MKNFKILIVGLFVLFIHSGNLLGQGWEKSYGDWNASTRYHSFLAIPVSNNDIIVSVPYYYTPNVLSHHKLFQIDGDGVLNWEKTLSASPTSINNNANKIMATFMGSTTIPGAFIEYNPVGNMAWSYIQNNLFIRDGFASKFGGYFIVTNSAGNSNNTLYRMDSNMNIKWSKNIYTYVNLKEMDNGNIIYSEVNGVNITILDSLSNTISSFASSLSTNPFGVLDYTSDNQSYIFTGFIGEFGPFNFNDSVFVARYDLQGNSLWMKNLFKFSYGTNGTSALYTKDNHILISTERYIDSAFPVTNNVAKLDTMGNVIWNKKIGNQFFSLQEVIELDSNNFLAVGTIISPITLTNKLHIVKFDGNGNTSTNLIRGNVYTDFNLNCTYDNGDLILNNKLIELSNATDTLYFTTDSLGFYAFNIDSGSYNLTIAPSHPYWQTCLPQTINVNQYDTVNLDLVLQPFIYCPLLEVSISTPLLRRCFSNTYTVNYYNDGTQPAQNAYIEVELDPFFVLTSTSIPYTSQVGNIYTFPIGTVNISQSGSFQIQGIINCSSVLGQTHCVEAHIYPDLICTANGIWSDAEIITSAICENDDSIRFKIENIGQADMTQARQYWVIEDQVLPLQGTFQLPTGADTTWIIPANGATYRLEAQQEITHPNFDQIVSSTLFGCGSTTPTVNNFVNQFALNDVSNFIDVDCQQNIGSFDPNDKTGYPIGYGSPHFITKNDDIEYHIRFQNTGTDTAFRVVIRDTIDTEHLDISSIQMMTSSHNYNFNITNGNTLKFTFNNIMLPDSNTNEPASHGFIRFKIGQKANNAIGTVIENSAAIYFDFNAPIITNTTFHTVGENFIQVVSTKPIQEKLASVKVFPNPFSEQATFEIETEEQYQNLTLTIYNVMGQAVKTIKSNGDNRMILDRNGLTSGVYFYQIQSEGLVLDSGKLMVQ